MKFEKKTKQKQTKKKGRVETLVETQSAEDYLFLCDGGKHSCFYDDTSFISGAAKMTHLLPVFVYYCHEK